MASNNDNRQLFEEWKGFLVSSQSNLRLAAVKAVLEIQDPPTMAQCIQEGLIPLLIQNIQQPNDNISVFALKSLVHLSSNGPSANQAVHELLDQKGVNRLLELLLEPIQNETIHQSTWRQKVNFSMSLLANMTRTEQGVVDLIGKSMPEEAVPSNRDNDNDKKLPPRPTLDLLLNRFLNPSFLDASINSDTYTNMSVEAMDSSEIDPYQHFAAVLMNVTQTEAGRQFVLQIHRPSSTTTTTSTATTTVLQQILAQLKCPNPIRRRGIAGTIRNCCLERDSAWWFLNIVQLTKHLLYPLAGPEELNVDEKTGLDPDLWLQGPDKVREPDHKTRLWLVESILLLCSTGRASRETLRLQRAYVVLKWADMVEEHEDVSECIYDCVNYLRGDEAGTQEGSSDKFVEEAYRRPCHAQAVGTNEDFDDVD